MQTTVQLLGGMRLIQDDSYHQFGLDSVLLSDFTTVKKNMHVMDLGAGCGTLSILLAARERTAVIDGLELSEGACSLARQNIVLNDLSNRVSIYCADLCSKNLPVSFGTYDLIVTNPPYFAEGSGKKAEGERNLARCDESCPLSSLAEASRRLLKWGGYFSVVYRPERLCELIACLKAQKIEPKRMRLVYKDPFSVPSLVLLEGKVGASVGLKILPPLFTKSETGEESDELKRIYQREFYK
ncbi:MAG: methyltransferase [Clostridiales bacterium]|nr:methyltransferase [Clostridiales bacterium]